LEDGPRFITVNKRAVNQKLLIPVIDCLSADVQVGILLTFKELPVNP